MTKIQVKKNELGIQEIKLSGHAFFSDYGNDIVCAALSMLSYTIGNQMLIIDEDNSKVEIKEGFFLLANSTGNQKIILLFDTLFLGLKMLEEQYPKQVKIKEVQNV